MICLVAQCGSCGVRWATGAVRNLADLGHAVALLAKTTEQGSPVCVHCSGGTASDKEVAAHDRAVELAKGTNLPECPYCEAKGADLVELDEGGNCCEEGEELGWWGPPSGEPVIAKALTAGGRWHRKSLEERPS